MRRSFRPTTETYQSGAKTLPQRYFVSPELFKEEQEKVFADHWILVGHQSELPNTGDYLVAIISGESVIVIRDQSGALHAFHNVCRHRGTRLCENNRGHVRAIQCPYHAWTYGLDGQLIGAPHMDDVPGFKKKDYSLWSVRAGIWEGFVFVNLGGASTQRRGYNLEEWFAPLAGKFSRWNLPNLRAVRRIEYEIRANWKLIFENYSECYHCPGVHPGLSKLSPYDSAENDLAEGPFLGGFMKINPGKSLTMSGNACAISVGADQEQELAAASPSDGGHDKENTHRVYYYSIFPNMLLSIHPDYVMVHQLWPKAPDHTLIYCDWFFHPDAASRSNFKPNDAVEFWDMTNKQDWHVCELSQQGIASRAYQPGPYSSRESIPAAWDRFYLQIMK